MDADWRGALGPWGAHLDPFGEGCDLFGGELSAALRHLQRAGLMDRFDQEALVGIAENDCGAGFAALEQRFLRGDRKAASGAVLVAGAALRGEDGADFVLEEFIAGCAFGLRGGKSCDDRPGALGIIPGAAALDPFDEVGDLALVELGALGRHLEVAGLSDCLNEKAVLGILGDDGGS